MNRISVFKLFLLLSVFEGGLSSEAVGAYFYKELGCTEKNDGKIAQYECPNLKPTNGSCNFKGSILNFGEYVDREQLKGSCRAACHCGYDGLIRCAQIDCFQRLKPGCSHFKYSLDGCCPVDSVCGPIATCEIEGKSYKEGNRVSLKNKCEVCVCDVGFELKAPFCRPRKCYDQAIDSERIANNGAPAFFKGENCCPDIWIVDEGQEIVKINADAASETGVSCNFGKRKIKLGYGFKTKETPYGKEIQFICECNMPPFVICREDVQNSE